ncbi:MAG TPA: hypothetical protein VL503_08115 [Candidatus Omnitrophota bacterium]|jgi:hypothetical protein|nr:hypothetical protein [Candidatus Omnitrophota bacterium]
MKAIIIALSFLAAIAVVAAPALGKEPSAATATAATGFFLSRMDQVMISAQDLSEWMARHKTRLELRDTNHAIEQMCDRLQDAERRMGTIANDPALKPGDPQVKEVQRFGEEIGDVARELGTLHASVRRMAEATPAPPDSSVPETERQRLQVRQSDLIASLDLADKHGAESHAWVIQKPASRGLDEMSRDIDLARDELRGMITSLGRLIADPALSIDRARDLGQVQDCSRALLQALGEAQDRIATLASAP